MILIPLCIGAITGMFIGRFFRDPENDCPQVELGRRCQADLCDHSESALYQAKAIKAKEQEKNYWRGGPHA